MKITRSFFTCTLCLFLLAFSFQPIAIYSEETPLGQPLSNDIAQYLELLGQYPEVLGPFGSASENEIEIVRDPKKIAEIQIQTGRPIGVVGWDKYWFWINDPVKFPSGAYGIYGRISLRRFLKKLPGGVCVMAMTSDGKIILNRNYRHATRSWEFELPRGGVEAGETQQEAAKRELQEETGMIVTDMFILGKMAPDAGVLANIVTVYFAKVTSHKTATPEEGEAIAAIHAFSIDEIKKGYLNGYIEVEEKGHTLKIPLRDPFLTFALFMYDLKCPHSEHQGLY
jgi:ADP-ribose pyrophosphatase